MDFQQPPAGTRQLFVGVLAAAIREPEDLARLSASTNSAKEAELEIRNETLFALKKFAIFSSTAAPVEV